MKSSSARTWCAAAAATLSLCSHNAFSWNTLPSRSSDEPGFAYTTSPSDWRTHNIYHLVTDRFFDGDQGNNNARGGFDSANGHKAHGGDWKGLQSKLDYLKEMGVTAIWISPISYNIDFTTDKQGNVYVPYHGYMPTDLNRINPVMGSLQDLRNMIDAAHARGIYVILDIVVNHLSDLMASNTPWKNEIYNVWEFTDPIWHRGYGHAAPFNTFDAFHKNGAIQNYDDVNQYLRGELTGGPDDLATEKTWVRNDLLTIMKALISATDCDGFRIDAVKHVESDFWDFFMPNLRAHASYLGKNNFLMFGEVFSGSDQFVASFTGNNRFHSMLYFPMSETMRNVFIYGWPTAELTKRTDALFNYNGPSKGQLINFLDNHDTPRYLAGGALGGDKARLKVALAWMYTSHQIPCLYYGTEQGFDGGKDPWNREDMWDGNWEFGPSNGDNFNTSHELFKFVKQLNGLRATYPALTLGTFAQRWQEAAGEGAYAYTKTYNGQEVVVVLNTSSQTKNCYPGTSLPAGTTFANALDPADVVTADAGKTLPVSIGARGVKIYVPSDNKKVSWVGNTYHWPPNDQLDAADEIWINTESSPLGAGVSGQVAFTTDGTNWSSAALTTNGVVSGKNAWHANLGKFATGVTIRYRVSITDREGLTTTDNNGGQNFSATVGAASPVKWVGNTYNWPADGQITGANDIWINTESWEKGSGTNAIVVYTTNRVAWSAARMNKAGAMGNNDWWNCNLGKFPAGSTVEYAVAVIDAGGAYKWDSRNGQNYRCTVKAATPVQWIGYTYSWPPNGQVTTQTDIWVNTETWPKGAGVQANIVYTTDGKSWTMKSMSKAGEKVNNDWWNVNLGKFPSKTIIKYAVQVIDANGNGKWDNNGGKDFAVVVN